MAALPPITDFTSGSVSEGAFKTALSGLRDFLSGLLGAGGTQGPALAALGAPFNTVSVKTGTYTVVAGDRGKHFDLSGTFTLGFTAAATLGDGFSVSLRNSGAGSVTVDPNASETLDGSTSVILAPGQSLVVLCDGSSFRSIGKTAPAGALLNVQVFIANNTYTPTAGVTRLWVEALGPGAPGATGGSPPAGNGTVGVKGADGQGGARRVLFTTNVVAQAVTIGASGSTTSFGSLLTAGQGSIGAGGYTSVVGHAPGRNTQTNTAIASAGPANSGSGGVGGAPGSNDGYGSLQTSPGAGGAGGSGWLAVFEYA